MTTSAGAHAFIKPSPRQRVEWAIDQGWSDPKAIAIYTTLTLDRVYTELGRLADLKRVVKVSKGCWKRPGDVCLLAATWR